MKLVINDRIRNRSVEFFGGFDIKLQYAQFGSTFTISYPFNPNNPEHKEFSCIGHYHIAYLEHNGKRLLTGYLLSPRYPDGPEEEMATISGYSLPGCLNDCNIPVSAYPLQSDGLSLRQIVDKVLKPFGIQYIVHDVVKADMDLLYDETTAEPKDMAGAYLTTLASERNIIITCDVYGRLVFTRPSRKTAPVFNFERGLIPNMKMDFEFNGQAMHSSITVMQQADKDSDIPGVEGTIINPYVPFVFRPRVEVQTSGDAKDTGKLAQKLLAEELRNIKLTIQLDRWDINNKILMPGDMITAINPKVYLYKKMKFMIEGVDFDGDATKQISRLHCVIPEVYSGDLPEYAFKGINLH